MDFENEVYSNKEKFHWEFTWRQEQMWQPIKKKAIHKTY